MIEIEFKTTDESISLEITGHAPRKNPLGGRICAIVSCFAISLVSALGDTENAKESILKHGKAVICADNTKENMLIFSTILKGFMFLALAFPEEVVFSGTVPHRNEIYRMEVTL